MLNATLPKYFQQYKQIPYKSSEKSEKTDELYKITPKNLKISLNKIKRQMYGRKYTGKQSQEHNFTNQDKDIPARSVDKAPLQFKNRGITRQNKSVYSKDKNLIIKRPTQNYLSPSLESRNQTDYQISIDKHQSKKMNRSCNTTQEAYPAFKIKGNPNERYNFNDEIIPNFYRTQIEVEDEDQIVLQSKQRKISMQNRLVPIEHQNIYEKPTFIDLIKKFKFENLKNTINENLNLSQKYQRAFKICRSQKQSSSQFFKQGHLDPRGSITINKTANRLCKRANQHRKLPSKLSIKEPFSNQNRSAISPWGTVVDGFSVHQIQA